MTTGEFPGNIKILTPSVMLLSGASACASVSFLTVLSNFDRAGSVSIMHETTGSFSVGKKIPHNTTVSCRPPLQVYSAISLRCDLLRRPKVGD